jgi:acetyl-CoA synthetase
MLSPANSYAGAVAAFRWEIPARYNIGIDVADKHVLEGEMTRLPHGLINCASSNRRRML